MLRSVLRLFAVLCGLCLPTGAVAVDFDVIDLGTIGDETNTSSAKAVSNTGHVVGVWVDSDDDTHAFYWTEATRMVDIFGLDESCSAIDLSEPSVAVDVNDLGQVVGWATSSVDGTKQAYVWTHNDGCTLIGALGDAGSEALRINESGQVLGESRATDNWIYAFLWTADYGMTPIEHAGWSNPSMHAADLNDSGMAVGDCDAGLANDQQACVWTANGGLVAIVDPEDTAIYASSAVDVNNAGQVVGWIRESPNPGAFDRAFVWTQSGGLKELDVPTELGTWHEHWPRAINDDGQIVGKIELETSGGNTHDRVFVWSEDQGMFEMYWYRLYNWGTGDPSDLHDAVGINNNGLAIGYYGYGWGATGDQWGMIWTEEDGMQWLTPFPSNPIVNDVSDNGWVVGSMKHPSLPLVYHATLWKVDYPATGGGGETERVSLMEVSFAGEDRLNVDGGSDMDVNDFVIEIGGCALTVADSTSTPSGEVGDNTKAISFIYNGRHVGAGYIENGLFHTVAISYNAENLPTITCADTELGGTAIDPNSIRYVEPTEDRTFIQFAVYDNTRYPFDDMLGFIYTDPDVDVIPDGNRVTECVLTFDVAVDVDIDSLFGDPFLNRVGTGLRGGGDPNTAIEVHAIAQPPEDPQGQLFTHPITPFFTEDADDNVTQWLDNGAPAGVIIPRPGWMPAIERTNITEAYPSLITAPDSAWYNAPVLAKVFEVDSGQDAPPPFRIPDGSICAESDCPEGACSDGEVCFWGACHAVEVIGGGE